MSLLSTEASGGAAGWRRQGCCESRIEVRALHPLRRTHLSSHQKPLHRGHMVCLTAVSLIWVHSCKTWSGKKTNTSYLHVRIFKFFPAVPDTIKWLNKCVCVPQVSNKSCNGTYFYPFSLLSFHEHILLLLLFLALKLPHFPVIFQTCELQIIARQTSNCSTNILCAPTDN